MLNSFFTEAVHISGTSSAIAHDFELHHVVFYMFWEYTEKKQSARDKRYKDKSRCRKEMSHNVVVFMVLHQAEEGLLNTEGAG